MFSFELFVISEYLRFQRLLFTQYLKPAITYVSPTFDTIASDKT